MEKEWEHGMIDKVYNPQHITRRAQADRQKHKTPQKQAPFDSDTSQKCLNHGLHGLEGAR